MQITVNIPLLIDVNDIDESSFDEHDTISIIKDRIRSKLKRWNFTDNEIDAMSFEFDKPFLGMYSDLAWYTKEELHKKLHRIHRML